MRLLVAENDPALGIFLRRGFGAEHYTVDLTQNGEQARSLVQDNEYDLAILDLSLPKEEGVAVLRTCASRGSRCPYWFLQIAARLQNPRASSIWGRRFCSETVCLF